jgi:hypothetical protein
VFDQYRTTNNWATGSLMAYPQMGELAGSGSLVRPSSERATDARALLTVELTRPTLNRRGSRTRSDRGRRTLATWPTSARIRAAPMRPTPGRSISFDPDTTTSALSYLWPTNKSPHGRVTCSTRGPEMSRRTAESSPSPWNLADCVRTGIDDIASDLRKRAASHVEAERTREFRSFVAVARKCPLTCANAASSPPDARRHLASISALVRAG